MTHEQETVSEAPSDYEFADDHGATADVDPSDEGNILPAEEESAPRRSPLLPIAAALGGVLILGGIAWYQFSGSTAPDLVPPPPVLSAALTAAPVAPVAAKTDMASASDQAVAPKPAATAPVATTVLPDAVVPAVTPAPAAPVVAAAPVQPVAAPVVTAAPVAASGANDARIEALTNRIDSLQKALDQANQQLGQVTNMVAATATTPAGSAAPASKDVQDRVTRLEQQLEALHQSAAVPALVSPATLSDKDEVVAKPVLHDAAASTAHKKVAAKPHKAPAKAVAKASPAKEKEEPVSTKWVLRAAVPGQAWVAAGATSHDLKQLQVGDTFAGIGRVTAIQQKDGAWSVQGTKGRIQ